MRCLKEIVITFAFLLIVLALNPAAGRAQMVEMTEELMTEIWDAMNRYEYVKLEDSYRDPEAGGDVYWEPYVEEFSLKTRVYRAFTEGAFHEAVPASPADFSDVYFLNYRNGAEVRARSGVIDTIWFTEEYKLKFADLKEYLTYKWDLDFSELLGKSGVEAGGTLTFRFDVEKGSYREYVFQKKEAGFVLRELITHNENEGDEEYRRCVYTFGTESVRMMSVASYEKLYKFSEKKLAAMNRKRDGDPLVWSGMEWFVYNKKEKPVAFIRTIGTEPGEFMGHLMVGFKKNQCVVESRSLTEASPLEKLVDAKGLSIWDVTRVYRTGTGKKAVYSVMLYKKKVRLQ